MRKDNKHIVFYSGGLGSWFAAKLAADEVGADNLTLLFTDTMSEDEDLYRFLHEGADAIGCKVTTISDGRTPWQVFRDVRFVGNSRVDPCSRVLKREISKKWVADNVEGTATLYLGIDFTEAHRIKAVTANWAPHTVRAPMIERMYDKRDARASLADYDVRAPRLYDLGFAHNNCGGFCVKAGQGQFKLLLDKMPERYAQHEAEQEATAEHIGSSHGFIRMTIGGELKYLTMREFREAVESQGHQIDLFDVGGCGCFMDSADV